MIDAAALRAYCLSKNFAREDFPFGDDIAVYKAGNKVFALIPVGGPLRISLKCEPLLAEMQRQTYEAVTPGYHLNKRHWNTVAIDGSIPDDEILEMVDHSHEQVIKKMSKAERRQLGDRA
jgi:predicted DNA-binding protein (MmcQ/YjbR family)